MTRTSLPALTDRIALGAHHHVSPFCLGMTFEPRMIPACFDAGVNFFFVSCDLHWPLYDGLRRGLEMLLARGGGIRDDIVIATASYISQTAFGGSGFYELLAALEIGRWDLLVAGGCYAPDVVPRLDLLRRVAAAQRAHGLEPPAIGASFHDRMAARFAIEHDSVDAAFVRYNPRHPGARDDLFPHVPARRRARIFNFKSMDGKRDASELALGDDFWIPAHADHYRYALSRPELDGILFSVKSEAELADLIGGLAQGPLTAEEQEHMETLARLPKNTPREALVSSDPGASNP